MVLCPDTDPAMGYKVSVVARSTVLETWQGLQKLEHRGFLAGHLQGRGAAENLVGRELGFCLFVFIYSSQLSGDSQALD